MHQFNRFYLIFSLIFSYSAPFISIKTDSPKPTTRLQTTIEATQQVLDLTSKQETFNWVNLVWIIYGIVTILFFAKAVLSILKIKNLKGRKIIYQNQNVLITKENISPFSFWKTIYLGENYWANNKIDSRIFLHEKSHLEQKHSIDLLFIEILKIFTWFNPLIYVYKNAIVTNHEFLADESVLKSDFNLKDYQKLILQEIISSQNYNLTHTFNFKNTKKRFIMMNTKKSKLTNIKKTVSIPVLMIAFVLFVQKTYATTIEKFIKETPEKISEPEKKSISEKIIDIQSKIQPEILEKTTQSEPIKTKNEEKIIKDTIRPKNNQNLTTNPAGYQNDKADTYSSTTKPENETPAEFPGGTDKLRNEFVSIFNAKNIKGVKGIIKSNITIFIDEKGDLKMLNITGDNESLNNEISRSLFAVVQNKKWKPGTKDGIPVESRFKLPVVFNIE